MPEAVKSAFDDELLDVLCQIVGDRVTRLRRSVSNMVRMRAFMRAHRQMPLFSLKRRMKFRVL